MAGSEQLGKGTWRQVAAVVDGKEVTVRKDVVLTVGDGGYMVTFGGKVFQRGTLNTDYTTTPHQSDVVVTEGALAGQTIPQIFKIEGDVLIACQAAPATPRPTEFTSHPGRSHMLSLWVRTTGAAHPWYWQSSAPLTGRTWFLIVLLTVLSGGVGGVSPDVGEALGSWAGILVGGLAGAAFVTALGLVLKFEWRAAVAMGVTFSVGSTTLESVKAAVSPALGGPGAMFVSGSSGLVAAAITWAIVSRLAKLRG